MELILGEAHRLDRVIELLEEILSTEKQIMATVQDVANAVAAAATVQQEAITLLGTLTAAVKAAEAAPDPTALQAAIDAITQQTAALQAAVTANTPVPPVAPAA